MIMSGSGNIFAKAKQALKAALCVGLVLFAVTARAQNAAEGRVRLQSGEITMAELFQEIKRQTGITVIFDAGNIHPTEVVQLDIREGTAAQLMDGALPADKYSWQAVDGYLVVRTLPEPPQVSASQTTAAAAVYRPAQPTRADFERDVAEYTRRYIPSEERTVSVKGAPMTKIRTETVVDNAQNGMFEYPSVMLRPHVTNFRLPESMHKKAPVLAVKTNMVWWGSLTPNGAAEVSVGRNMTLELAFGFNPWHLEGTESSNKKLTHWVVKPEFRYWFTERFSGHFIGLHGIYSTYNVGEYDIPTLFEKEYRYHGTAYGGGINYGYHWVLGKRFGIEFTAGVGVLKMEHTKNECLLCGDEIAKETKTWFGPTQLGVKLILMLK